MPLAFLMDTSFFFLFLCLLQTLPLSSSNTFDTLRGTSLSVENPSDILVSANGEYSAGFLPVGDNAFCFAIWFNKPTVFTVVWMANRDGPVDGRGSQLSVLNEGKLILYQLSWYHRLDHYNTSLDLIRGHQFAATAPEHRQSRSS